MNASGFRFRLGRLIFAFIFSSIYFGLNFYPRELEIREFLEVEGVSYGFPFRFYHFEEKVNGEVIQRPGWLPPMLVVSYLLLNVAILVIFLIFILLGFKGVLKRLYCTDCRGPGTSVPTQGASTKDRDEKDEEKPQPTQSPHPPPAPK